MQFLSLAECPIGLLPHPDDIESIPTGLNSLNVSTTKIDSWQEVEKLRKFPGLNDLRIQGCPFLDEFTRKEKRMLLVARLPNVTVLNGGDMITKTEREDAERAFIRHFLETPEEQRPARWQELVDIHGLLDPLVNIDLTPEMNIKVDIRTAICEFIASISLFSGLHLLQRSVQRGAHLCQADSEAIQTGSPRLLRAAPRQHAAVVLRPGDDQDCGPRGDEVCQQGAVHLQRHRRRLLCHRREGSAQSADRIAPS